MVNGILGLVVLPKVLHGLDVARYGEWATLAAFIAIGQLATVGVSTEIGRRVASANGHGDREGVRRAITEGTTVMCGLALVFEITGVALSHPAVNAVFTKVSSGQRAQLALLLALSVTLVAFSVAGSAYFGVLGGLQRSDYGNWSGTFSAVVSAIATVTGIALGLGLWALLVADYLQLVVNWVGIYIGIRRLVPDIHFRVTKVPRPVILSLLAGPSLVVFASASDLFDMQIDKLVLARHVGPAASGMFQIGVSLVTSAKSVALIPLGILFAGTAELYLTRPGRLRRLEEAAAAGAQAIAAITAGGFLIFAPTFLRTWLGPGFGQAALAMRVLGIAVLLNIWAAPWYYFAIGRGKYHYVLIAASVTLSVNAVCTIVLTSRIGLPGALIGSVAGSAAGAAAGWLVLRRWERRRWLRPALRASLLVALAVVPFLALARHVPNTWVGLTLWASAYLAVCGLVLVVTRSLPLTVTGGPGVLPRLVWRDIGGTDDGVAPGGPSL